MLTSQPAAWRAWSARIVVSLVLVANLSAAIPYLVNPAAYAGAFELSGTPAAAMVRGIGILFLMWNVTYLPVIVDPLRQRTLFGHAALAASGLRFVAFDSTGLVLLLAAFLWTRRPAA
jgi:hypothetical protein